MDYLETEIQMQLRNNISPQFWRWFKKDNKNQCQEGENYKKVNDGNNSDNYDDTFINAVRELHNSVSKLIVYVQRMDQLAAHFKQVN